MLINNFKTLSKKILKFTSVLFLFFSVTAVFAASIDTGQVENRFERLPQAQVQPGVIEVPQTDGVEAPSGADSITFTLMELRVEDVSVYSPQIIKSYFADKLNQTVSLKQIYEIAAQLSSRYGEDGYLLSRAVVPPQTIDNGLVRIRVIEGYIDKVEIKDVNERPEIFQNLVDNIIASRPLHTEVLERYLLLANDLSGLTFKSVLNPSPEKIGAANLVMVPSRSPYQNSISIDNRGSESSGPLQMVMEFTANNLFKQLEKTMIRLATVPDDIDELKFFHLQHLQVINGEGLTLALDLKHTRTEPGLAALNLLNVETEGDNFGVALRYPLIRSRERNLTLSGMFDIRSSKTLQLGTTTSDDQLRAIRFGATYDYSDTFGGGGVTLFNASLVQGMDMMDAQVQSRNGAQPDFNKFELQARRTQFLAQRWTLDILLTGQLTDEALPAAEQYGLGSENSVRGYEPAEWTGDSALAGNFELRYDHEATWANALQYYLFYDHGKVWREQPAAGELKTDSANSTGIGIRMDLDSVSFNIEADRTLDTHADGERPGWEVFGQLAVRF